MRSYPVLVRSNIESKIESALVPDVLVPTGFNTVDFLRINLTQNPERYFLQKMGLNRYLESVILQTLEEKDEREEVISNPKSMDFYRSGEYAFYIVTSKKDINPRKIRQKSIFMIGEATQRQAYIVESGKFIMEDKQPLCIQLTLSEVDSIKLNNLRRSDNRVLRCSNNLMFLNRLADEICSRAKRPLKGPFDYWMPVDVYFRSKHKCHCCTKFIPPIARIALSIELIAIIPMLTGAFISAFNGLMPKLGRNAKDSLSVLGSVSFSAVLLAMNIQGIASKSLASLGDIVDEFYYRFSRRFRGVQPGIRRKSVPKKCFSWGCVLTDVARFIFVLGIADYLFGDVAMDYQQFNAQLKQNLNMPSIFPHWVIVSSTWINFSFGRLTEPVMVVSFLNAGFYMIKNHFQPVHADYSVEGHDAVPVIEELALEEVKVEEVKANAPSNLGTSLLNPNESKSDDCEMSAVASGVEIEGVEASAVAADYVLEAGEEPKTHWYSFYQPAKRIPHVEEAQKKSRCSPSCVIL